MYTFGLPLFSFFNPHDYHVCSFDGIAEFLRIPFELLSLLFKNSVFSLISGLSF
jgi:hypothetical protein